MSGRKLAIAVGGEMWLSQEICRTKRKLRLACHVAFALTPLLVVFCCILASPAVADEDIVEDIVIFSDLHDDLQETLRFDSDPKKAEDSDWSFMLGVLVGFKPEYEGSKDYEFAFAPNYKISWRDIIIVQGKNLRVQYKHDKLRIGAIVSRAAGRDEDDNDNLDGLGDVDSGWLAGGFVNYRVFKRVRLKAEGRQAFAGGHDGFLLDVGTDIKLPLEKSWLGAYVGATFASDNYMDAFFSIDGAQSAASGKKTFNADAGLKNLTLSLSSGYDITKNWVVGAILRYDRLTGDAGDSPVVQDGGSKNQLTGGLSISYQF